MRYRNTSCKFIFQAYLPLTYLWWYIIHTNICFIYIKNNLKKRLSGKLLNFVLVADSMGWTTSFCVADKFWRVINCVRGLLFCRHLRVTESQQTLAFLQSSGTSPVPQEWRINPESSSLVQLERWKALKIPSYWVFLVSILNFQRYS